VRHWLYQGITRAVSIVAAVAILAMAAAHAQTAKPPQFAPRDEDPKEYAAGPGRDDTFYACTACHAFKIVAQQGMTREQWDESLNWMTQRHKMPPITGKDRDVILAYLAANYGPKPDAGARGWKNPFAPQ
jgi:hypothetical protein